MSVSAYLGQNPSGSNGVFLFQCKRSSECEFLTRIEKTYFTTLESKKHSRRYIAIGSDTRIKRARRVKGKRLVEDHFFLEFKKSIKDTDRVLRSAFPRDSALLQHCAEYVPTFSRGLNRVVAGSLAPPRVEAAPAPPVGGFASPSEASISCQRRGEPGLPSGHDEGPRGQAPPERCEGERRPRKRRPRRRCKTERCRKRRRRWRKKHKKRLRKGGSKRERRRGHSKHRSNSTDRSNSSNSSNNDRNFRISTIDTNNSISNSENNIKNSTFGKLTKIRPRKPKTLLGGSPRRRWKAHRQSNQSSSTRHRTRHKHRLWRPPGDPRRNGSRGSSPPAGEPASEPPFPGPPSFSSDTPLRQTPPRRRRGRQVPLEQRPRGRDIQR